MCRSEFVKNIELDRLSSRMFLQDKETKSETKRQVSLRHEWVICGLFFRHDYNTLRRWSFLYASSRSFLFCLFPYLKNHSIYFSVSKSLDEVVNNCVHLMKEVRLSEWSTVTNDASESSWVQNKVVTNVTLYASPAIEERPIKDNRLIVTFTVLCLL